MIRRLLRALARRPLVASRTALAAVIALFATHADAGSVSGAAQDESGKPVQGAHIEVVYQTYRADQLGRHGASVKKTTVTGADGRFQVDMSGLPPGAYVANAYRSVMNGGRAMIVHLSPRDPSPFPQNETVVRDFVAEWIESSDQLPYGNGGIFVVQNAVMDYTDLAGAEVTLAEVGSGRTFVKAVRRTGEGLVVTGIPFGTYRCSVRLGGKPMQVALSGSDRFAESVVHDFTMGPTENQIRVDVKP